jgi:hypothetical protein
MGANQHAPRGCIADRLAHRRRSARVGAAAYACGCNKIEQCSVVREAFAEVGIHID